LIGRVPVGRKEKFRNAVVVVRKSRASAVKKERADCESQHDDEKARNRYDCAPEIFFFEFVGRQMQHPFLIHKITGKPSVRK
jgi:hypothetical protein